MHRRASSMENIGAYIHAHRTIFVISVKTIAKVSSKTKIFKGKNAIAFCNFCFVQGTDVTSLTSLRIVSKSVYLMSEGTENSSSQMFLINKGNFHNTV